MIFDFYFGDVSDARREYNEQSVNVGNRVQDEDLGICEDVQRGLKSRAYRAGRLSVRREAGEQLFHRLLAADLKRGVEPSGLSQQIRMHLIAKGTTSVVPAKPRTDLAFAAG